MKLCDLALCTCTQSFFMFARSLLLRFFYLYLRAKEAKKRKDMHMYTIKTEASFDSAHFLKGYQGKCSNLHGHRWRVVVEVQSEELKEDEQFVIEK